MTQRHDAEVFQILIGEITKNRAIDIVLGETRSVLGHAEAFEPVRNFLHELCAALPAIGTT